MTYCNSHVWNLQTKGDNINSAILFFIERLSSFRSSQCVKLDGKYIIFWTLSNVPIASVYMRFIIAPYYSFEHAQLKQHNVSLGVVNRRGILTFVALVLHLEAKKSIVFLTILTVI